MMEGRRKWCLLDQVVRLDRVVGRLVPILHAEERIWKMSMLCMGCEKRLVLLLRIDTARVHARRTSRVIMFIDMKVLAITVCLILLQTHHASNIAIAVPQAVRRSLLRRNRGATSTLVHLDGLANSKVTAGRRASGHKLVL